MWQFDENVEVGNLAQPNIFGFWRHFIRFSPLNCSKGLLQIPLSIFSLAVFLAMCFRIYWMFWRTHTEFLTYGWGESNLYAFLTFESFSLLIAIFQMTRRDSLRRLEVNIGTLKTFRVKKFYEEFDSYKKVHIKIFIFLVFIGVSIIGSAIYLLANKEIIVGTTHQSTWFYVLNFIVNIFCFYVQLLYLPVHVLIHSAIRKEIDVFNVELEEALKDPKSDAFQKLETRQVTLLNFTNFMTTRFNSLLNYAGFTILVAVLNGSYITSSLYQDIDLLYYFCNLTLSISTIIITCFLLYPQAMIQESLLKTSRILLSTSTLQQPPDVFQNCRLMMDRSLYNRQTCTVIHIFEVSRKNIERALFVLSITVIVMVVTYKFMRAEIEMGTGLAAASAALKN